MPIAASNEQRTVPEEKISRRNRRRLREIKCRIGPDAPLVPLFSDAQSMHEALVYAEIISQIGLKGSMNPHEVWRQIREDSKILQVEPERAPISLPDRRTIDRRVDEMERGGYLEITETKKNPINREREVKKFDLTMKGVVAALTIGKIVENLDTFLSFKTSNGEWRVMCSRMLHLLIRNNLPSFANYLLRQPNQYVLPYIDTYDDADIRRLYSELFAAHIASIMKRVADQKIPKDVFPEKEIHAFLKAITTNVELGEALREITQEAKESAAQVAGDLIASLEIVKKSLD